MLETVLQSGGPPVEPLLILVIAVIQIAGLWKVFTKAGQPGWAALIPIFNVYVMFKIGGNPGWYMLLLLIPFVNLYALFKLADGISKAFGQGIGFTIGLFFLNPIFIPLLGFGNYRYQGAPR